MTSVFLHAFPAVVAWAQRWYPPDGKHWKGAIVVELACARQAASTRELILIPWLPYAAWAIAYYLKIFVISSRRIQDRGYHTLYLYLARKPTSFFGVCARVLPRWLSGILFMMWHIIFCAVTFVFAWGMWQSFALNTAFLIAMISISAWNGGNYYFEVFARRYLQDTGLPVETHARRHSADESREVEGDDLCQVVRASSDGALNGGKAGEWLVSVAATVPPHALGTSRDGTRVKML
jgi:hypothetical protein